MLLVLNVFNVAILEKVLSEQFEKESLEISVLELTGHRFHLRRIRLISEGL
jgi:hypothetical protein